MWMDYSRRLCWNYLTDKPISLQHHETIQFNCKWNWQRQRAFCFNLSQWERNGVQLMCLWLMHINTSTLLPPQGLGMGVWGLFRNCHVHTQLWLQSHVTHMWPKCKYYIYICIFKICAFIFSQALSSRHTTTYIPLYTQTHAQSASLLFGGGGGMLCC